VIRPSDKEVIDEIHSDLKRWIDHTRQLQPQNSENILEVLRHCSLLTETLRDNPTHEDYSMNVYDAGIDLLSTVCRLLIDGCPL
jgi:hypothetical protein